MEWDYIIVGAGSSGCAAAYELARKGGNRVLLLEAGGRDRSFQVKIPAFVGQLGQRFGWGYVSQPDESREGRREPWLRGRLLGGSSSINGMMFVRGAPADFDHWAQLGNPGWSYRDVLPIFRDLELTHRRNKWRGNDGPMYVDTVTRAHSLTRAFLASAVAAGIPLNEDYNAETQEGAGYAQLSQRRGLRWSAADGFIRPLKRCKTFRLALHAEVRRLVIKGGRVAGVLVQQSGSTHRYMASRVILSAGAINTPKLLMLSGIGDPKELRRHGIDVAVELPGVGKNLQEHPLVRLVYRSRIESNNLSGGLAQKLRIAANFALYRSGPIATPFEGVAFVRSTPSKERADLQVHFVPVGLLSYDANEKPFLPYPPFLST